MKDLPAALLVWVAGVTISVWLELGCGWRAGGGGAVVFSGVVWWTLALSGRRELGWAALALVPLSGLGWTWTGYPGAGAMGFALAAAVMPAALVGEKWWQPFAGSGFVAGVAMAAALAVEAVSSGRLPAAGPGLLASWLLSAVGGGVLALTMLSADGLLGLGRPRHLTSRFRMDAAGYRQRVRGMREEP